MSQIQERLEDLVADVPAYVVPDARAAWAAGARRRTRHRLSVAVAVVAVLAVVAGAVGWMPRMLDPSPVDSGSSPGYPAYVDKPWFLGDLPSRPGPLSAVVREPSGTWLAASPEGRVWRVPEEARGLGSFSPALSDDGRMIGYLADATSGFVLRNVVTGDETRFDQVTDNLVGDSDLGAWWVDGQAPAYWSPDGTKLVVLGAAWDPDQHVRSFVMGTDGSLTPVASPPHGPYGYPVGWLDNETLAILAEDQLLVTDVAGHIERSIDLPVTGHVSQWSGALSADRKRLAIVLAGDTGTILTVSTSDGTELSRENVGAPSDCSPTWMGEHPAFFQDDIIQTTFGRVTIAVDPAIHATCVLVTAAALGGVRHERPSWHWPEVALGLVAAAGVALVGIRWNRRRRAHRLG